MAGNKVVRASISVYFRSPAPVAGGRSGSVAVLNGRRSTGLCLAPRLIATFCYFSKGVGPTMGVPLLRPPAFLCPLRAAILFPNYFSFPNSPTRNPV